MEINIKDQVFFFHDRMWYLPLLFSRQQIPGFETVIEDPKGEVKENNSSAPEVVKVCTARG